ncbi:MAG: Clp protease N-terminal domain-containing protein [Candidatus Dormibacteria bacterium]
MLTLAQEEAERAHHSYIGSEHLLLGLLRERDGRAAAVLANLGIEIKKVRSTMEAILGRNERIIIQQIIPTSRVKKIIEISFGEARSMGRDEVGTEHILLALLIEGQGIAAHILQDLGAGLGEVREQLSLMPPATPAATEAGSVQSPAYVLRTLAAAAADDERARLIADAVTQALALAGERGEKLGTEHLLLALSEQGSTTAGEILGSHGLNRSAIEWILDNPPGR